METTTSVPRYPKEKNKVIGTDFQPSRNFYQSDKILRNYLEHELSSDGLGYMQDKLHYTGREAAGQMNELSLLADKHGPTLVKRNFFGETINQIEFHPAYWDLMKIAVRSEMFRIKWQPSTARKI